MYKTHNVGKRNSISVHIGNQFLIKIRHEKSSKHASIACRHFLRKLWTFLHKLHISIKLMSTNLHYDQWLIQFYKKYPIKGTENILGAPWGHFYSLRINMILWTFSNRENLLADKKQLFSCLIKMYTLYITRWLEKTFFTWEIHF